MTCLVVGCSRRAGTKRMCRAHYQSKNKPSARVVFVSRIKYHYGLTFEAWDRMILAQSGRCIGCLGELRDACVDHCHATERVRGILCRECNIGIGKLREDPVIFARLVEYLGAPLTGV